MTKVFFIVVVLLLLGEREGRLVRSQETFWAPAMLNKASGKDSAIKTEDVTDSNCRPDMVVWTCCILQGGFLSTYKGPSKTKAGDFLP